MKIFKLLMLPILLPFFVLFNFTRCIFEPQEYYLERFLDKYENENFDLFKNRSFVIRSINRDGPLVIIKPDIQDIHKTYWVKLNSKTNTVTCHYSKYLNDSISTDTATLNTLASRFSEFKISYLKVDSFGNVYINVTNDDHKQLIRVINKSAVPEIKNGSWKMVRKNWYSEG